MKAQEFERNSSALLEHCNQLLFGKAHEYASDKDRLANFKQATSLFGTNPAIVCLFWDAKHIASMAKIADDLNTGIYPTREMLLEKCSDYINYGLLYYSLVLEMIEEHEKLALSGTLEDN